MATGGVPYALGSATHAARALRNVAAAILGLPWATHANAVSPTTRGGGYGVDGDGDLLVTSTGGLGYSVAAGRVVAAGANAAAQGVYVGFNDAPITGSVTARHATLDRIDVVAYRVRDTDEDASTFEDDGVVVIAGVPEASPVAPALPATLGSLCVLCEIRVPSAANNGPLIFTDRRQFIACGSTSLRVPSSLRPTGVALRRGLRIFETDTGNEFVYNGSAFEAATVRFIRDGVEIAAPTGQLTVQSGSTVVGTDVNGDFTIVFPVAFLSAPTMVAMGGDGAVPIIVNMSSLHPVASGFGGRIHQVNGAGVLANSTVRIRWTAIGYTT